ncbi:MAG: RAMP superfamily CRISPR-associated protein [Candidatus Baldrarchaeota archaeon]|nr:RAMP superfamily CRISPR-associated protein [Candidatus Baldrarchaeota archaeon]
MFKVFLENRFLIDLYLKPVDPLHIGAGGELFTRSILKMKVNKYYIPILPAESLKGVLRKLAMKIAKSMVFSSPDINEIVKCHRKDEHIRKDKEHCEGLTRKYKKNAIETMREIFSDKQIEELTERALLEYYFSLICPVCNLFGGKSVAAKLKFFDAYPLLNDKIVELKTKTYTSTSIDRQTGIAKEGRLYTIEFIEPLDNIRFKLRIIAENLEQGSDNSKLLANIFQYLLHEGIKVGGLKSKGFGTLKIDEEKTNIKSIHLKTPQSQEDLKRNILKLSMKEEYTEKHTLRGFIEWLKK